METATPSPTFEHLLAKHFRFSHFRAGQREIVESIVGGRDVVALMPTGGGKSLCYQLPALMLEGLTVVISPLIALMKDQVDSLRARGIGAAFFNSTQTPEEAEEILGTIKNGSIKLLYLAPERFRSHGFRELFATLPIRFIAVDEAHCVSAWGHDFRPDYLMVKDYIALLPTRPVVGAFTATATPEVKEDIVHRLALRGPHVFVRGFDRPNLKFFVRDNIRPKDRRVEAIRIIQSLSGNGIVYTITRKEAEEFASLLQRGGITAAPYHAGLAATERTRIQNEFQENRFKVIVATIAFGMGVDKADIRYVIHLGMPSSLEGYYQEAGRAGRDGDGAYCILLHSKKDAGLHYHFLRESRQAMLEQGKSWSEVERVSNLKYERLQKMVAYATNRECRRRKLLTYFADPEVATYEENCRGCDVCLNFEWKEVPRRPRRGRWKLEEEAADDFVVEDQSSASSILGLTSTVAETVKLFQDSLRPEQIAKIRNLGLTTIYTHLITWYLAGGELDIRHFVTLEEEQLILPALAHVTEDKPLTSIKEHLPPEISYEKIRLVIAKVRRIEI